MPSALTRSLRRGDLDLGVSFDYPEIGDTFEGDLHLEHLLDELRRRDNEGKLMSSN